MKTNSINSHPNSTKSLGMTIVVILLLTTFFSCVNRPDPILDTAISQGQYMANSQAWSASIRKQGSDILIKNTDSTVGGAVSKQKVTELLNRIPVNGFLTYRFYTDPTSKKIALMFRAAQTATSEPLIFVNDKFCPNMCD